MHLRKLLLYVITLWIASSSIAQSVSNRAAARKPNIIFFLVDDLGWMDVGYNGSKFYETPNLDKLAKESVRFNQAYAACHVCSPSRASIMTGKYPARLNLTDWLSGRKDFSFQKLKNVPVNQHLPFSEKALPQALKENGYQTAIFGKWHLSEDTGTALLYGFNRRLPEWNAGWPLTYYPPYRLKGLEGPKDEYLTDRLTSEALKFIDSNQSKPFFLYLAHFAVHDPIEGRPDLVEKYKKKLQQMQKPDGPPYILEGNPDTAKQLSRETLNQLLKDPEYSAHKYLPNRTIKVKQFQDNVQFAAMVEAMDESMGRVISKLQELGIEDNTVIIFVSDNGGMAAANYGNPNRVIAEGNLDKAYSTSNLPLRGAKGWFYEGGIRVPMLVKWPGRGLQGAEINLPVITTDFYPTILDMAGMAQQPQQTIDGMDLTPLLTGKGTLKPRALYWHFPHYSNHGQQSPGGAIRFGDYKLLEYFENNTVQLFNIARDPGEQNDLAARQPGKVEELKNMLHAWRNNVGAKMMSSNPTYVAHQ